MFGLTLDEMGFIGLCLEGFFYGLYSGIFALYLRYQALKKDTNKTDNVIFYSICALYVLSGALFICEIIDPTFRLLGKPLDSILRILFVQTTSFGCCDFIAQFILIYRCWIVWGRNIRVVIIPSLLTFIFLVIWLVGGNSTSIISDHFQVPKWGQPVLLTSIALSLTVNTLVTGLIVFRIFKVFREVKVTSDDHILSTTGGGKLRRIIFILIESGMTLFSIQLVRLVVTIVQTDAATRAFNVIIGIHEMLNGITPTIILVRTSMGLSFNDEKSMEDVAIGSLRFAQPSETESIDIVDQDSRDGYNDVQRSNDIDSVGR